jgi:serine/threonine protein kinase
MSPAITEAFVLASDVRLTLVQDLPRSLREKLDGEVGGYALSRSRSRAPVRLLDDDSAVLLQRFRSPTRIIDAVLAYSRDRRTEPRATLDEAFPMLRGLIESQVLIAADSVEAMDADSSLQVGERFAGVRVVATLQSLEDTELHLVKDDAGNHAALKLFKTARRPAMLTFMRREAAILRRLDGGPFPRVLRARETPEFGYLLLEWRSGVSAEAAAAEARQMVPWDGGHALLELLRAIARTYALLHAARVVHGDVHPGNLIVDVDGSVTIVDFGLAVAADSPDEITAQAPRGGIAFYFEPEYAVAHRSGQSLPRASFLGEQHAVAACLYRLATGSHYLDFSLEPEEMLRQIAEDPPLLFTTRAVPAWPQLEAILAQCLTKRPERRLADVETLARRLDAVGAPATRTQKEPDVDLAPARILLEEVLQRLGLDGPLLPTGLSASPTSSLNYGAAGIAYALYRLACGRDDASLLALADVWVTLARAHMHEQSGCYSDELDITPETVGRISTFHTEAGVEAVATLIAHARGDTDARQSALAGFLEHSRPPSANLDLTLGHSSTLLACALLFEAMMTGDTAESDALRRFGDSTLDSIWTQIAGYPCIPDCAEIEYLGMAHGWAGLVYSALRWSAARRAPPPAGAIARLEELVSCAEPWGRGLRWTVRTSGSRAYMAGWCNGTAGFVHLFTLAHRTMGDDRWLSLAERAAWHSWEAGGSVSSLCCGYTGQAYALLNLHRHNGNPAWLRRARELTARAALAPWDGPEGRDDSLYKGRVGVALLAADIGVPELARMPFVEPEGWPVVPTSNV